MMHPLIPDRFLKLVFALGTAREWKCEHAGFCYPEFYHFIVDYLEDPKDDTSRKDINDLMKWWNWYCSFCLSLEYDVLISPFCSSEMFGTAHTNRSNAASNNPKQSTLKLLEETHARRARRHTLESLED